jgi:hypothetical protein
MLESNLNSKRVHMQIIFKFFIIVSLFIGFSSNALAEHIIDGDKARIIVGSYHSDSNAKNAFKIFQDTLKSDKKLASLVELNSLVATNQKFDEYNAITLEVFTDYVQFIRTFGQLKLYYPDLYAIVLTKDGKEIVVNADEYQETIQELLPEETNTTQSVQTQEVVKNEPPKVQPEIEEVQEPEPIQEVEESIETPQTQEWSKYYLEIALVLIAIALIVIGFLFFIRKSDDNDIEYK